MEISKDSFFSVGSHLNIPEEKIDSFWTSLEKIDAPRSMAFATYLYYFGALIVISAMTWFMGLSWEWFGGGGIFLIAISYALVFTLIGSITWEKRGLKIPSGLFITIAVCMTPLAIYGLETYLNIWPSDDHDKYQNFYYWVRGSWIFMEMGTILVGLIALFLFPYPFLFVPILFSAWFLTMDILPLFHHQEASWDQRSWISLGFGLVLIVAGFLFDRKNKADYGFWNYFFGTLIFWGALNSLAWDKGELVLLSYLLINLVMMCLAIVLRRKVLMTLGALGVFIYLGHLAYDIFQDSIWFPFILSFIGLAIIFLGILYQRNSGPIENFMFNRLPLSIRALLDSKKKH